MNGRRLISRLALALAMALAASRADSARAPSGAPEKEALFVFAAASLAESFGDIAAAFEHEWPGVDVRLNLAGSQQLAAQIQQGAEADVFASADERTMDGLRRDSLVAGEAPIFAGNRLVVVLPRTNPARIARLQDLARPGTRLVLGAEAVPVGRYSRDVLQRLATLDGFEPSFPRRAIANVVSEEENVKSVVGKVQLGEADAGICYRSDLTLAVSRDVRVIEIPADANVIARYPIAVLAGSRHGERARAFVAFVCSPRGQAILGRRGLIAVTEASP